MRRKLLPRAEKFKNCIISETRTLPQVHKGDLAEQTNTKRTPIPYSRVSYLKEVNRKINPGMHINFMFVEMKSWGGGGGGGDGGEHHRSWRCSPDGAHSSAHIMSVSRRRDAERQISVDAAQPERPHAIPATATTTSTKCK